MTAQANALRNRRGVALLVTLSVTTVLVAAGLEFNRRARHDLMASAASRDRLTMSAMASAGVNSDSSMRVTTMRSTSARLPSLGRTAV